MDRSWKIAGVAFGAAAAVATSTAAYACLPDSGTSTAPRTVATASLAQFHDRSDTAPTDAELSALSQLVARLQAKVAAFGTPSTITPRQAWKIKHTVTFIGFLQAKLAALPASQAAKADALAASLAALKSQLTSVLANATVAAPTTTTPTTTRHLHLSFRDFSRLGTRHVCDHDGARTYWRYRHHDGYRH